MKTSQDLQIELSKLEWIGETYLILSFHKPKAFQFRAGQHLTFKFKDADGVFQRSYSIASAPSDPQIEFCIQTSGDGRGAALFKALARGDLLTASPPSGSFHISHPEKPLVLIAGGSGLGPLRSFVKDLFHSGNPKLNITLIFGCKDAEIIPFREELEAMTKKSHGQLRVFLVAERGESAGVLKGTVVEALLKQENAATPSSDFYLCGPPGMITALEKALHSIGVSARQISVEKY